MAKLQLLAITTLDGYLFDRTVSSPLWDNPNKWPHQNTGTCYTDSRAGCIFHLIDTMEKEK